MISRSFDPADVVSLPQEIAPETLATMQQEERLHAILDVRETWELDICKFEDCLHIPLNDLPQRIDELPRDRPLIVVCHLGQRSLLATRWLRAAGLSQSTNLMGGVDAWADRINSGMRRY